MEAINAIYTLIDATLPNGTNHETELIFASRDTQLQTFKLYAHCDLFDMAPRPRHGTGVSRFACFSAAGFPLRLRAVITGPGARRETEEVTDRFRERALRQAVRGGLTFLQGQDFRRGRAGRCAARLRRPADITRSGRPSAPVPVRHTASACRVPARAVSCAHRARPVSSLLNVPAGERQSANQRAAGCGALTSAVTPK